MALSGALSPDTESVKSYLIQGKAIRNLHRSEGRILVGLVTIQ